MTTLRKFSRLRSFKDSVENEKGVSQQDGVAVMMGFIFLAGCGKELVRNVDSGVHKVYPHSWTAL